MVLSSDTERAAGGAVLSHRAAANNCTNHTLSNQDGARSLQTERQQR
jgi:hypothetical protein